MSSRSAAGMPGRPGGRAARAHGEWVPGGGVMSAGYQLSAPGAAAVIAAPTPRRSESSGALPRIEAAIESLPHGLLRGQIAQQVVDVRQFEEDRGLSGAFELGLAVELARLREVPAGRCGVSGALQPGPPAGPHSFWA